MSVACCGFVFGQTVPMGMVEEWYFCHWDFHLFVFLMFIFESESTGEVQRGRQMIQIGLCADSGEPSVGLELLNHEIMT